MPRTPQEIVEEAQRRVTVYWRPWKTHTSSAQTVCAKEAIDVLDAQDSDALQKLRGIVAAYVVAIWQFSDDRGETVVRKGDFWDVLISDNFLSEIFSLTNDEFVYPDNAFPQDDYPHVHNFFFPKPDDGQVFNVSMTPSLVEHFSDITQLNALLETCLFDSNRLYDFLHFLACVILPDQLVQLLYHSAFFEVRMHCTKEFCCGFISGYRKKAILTDLNVQDFGKATMLFEGDGGNFDGICFHQEVLRSMGTPEAFATSLFSVVSAYGVSTKESTNRCKKRLIKISYRRVDVNEKLKSAAKRIEKYVYQLFSNEEKIGPFFDLLKPYLSELFRHVLTLDASCKEELTVQRFNEMLEFCSGYSDKLKLLAWHAVNMYGGFGNTEEIVTFLNDTDLPNYLEPNWTLTVEDYLRSYCLLDHDQHDAGSTSVALTTQAPFDTDDGPVLADGLDTDEVRKQANQQAARSIAAFSEIDPMVVMGADIFEAFSTESGDYKVQSKPFCEKVFAQDARIQALSFRCAGKQLFVFPIDARCVNIDPNLRCSFWVYQRGVEVPKKQILSLVGFVGDEGAQVVLNQVRRAESPSLFASSPEGSGSDAVDLSGEVVTTATADKLGDAGSDSGLAP